MNDKLNKLASEFNEKLQGQGNELKNIKSKISEDLTAIEIKLSNKIEKNELIEKKNQVFDLLTFINTCASIIIHYGSDDICFDSF